MENPFRRATSRGLNHRHINALAELAAEGTGLPSNFLWHEKGEPAQLRLRIGGGREKLVAELSLDKEMLQDVVRRKRVAIVREPMAH